MAPLQPPPIHVWISMSVNPARHHVTPTPCVPMYLADTTVRASKDTKEMVLLAPVN